MKLTVIMLDTYRTYVAVAHENEHIPYGRRTVHIHLTPEQVELLRPRVTGNHHGKPQFEEVGQCWLEGQVPDAALAAARGEG